MELGLAKLDCWSNTIGISGISRSQGVASSSTSRLAGPSLSFLSSTPKSTARAVKKVQSRGHSDDDVEEERPRPWQLFWDIVTILEIVVSSSLVVFFLIRVAFFVGSRMKQKLREQRERRKVEDENWNMLRQRAAPLGSDTNLRPVSNNDSNPLLPAGSISNVEFFTAPEETGIGVASAPRNGVVDDEDVERGRPQERFWQYDPRNPRPGLASASTSTAVGRNEMNLASQIPSRDNSEASDIGVMDMGAGTAQNWIQLRTVDSFPSSSRSQQTGERETSFDQGERVE